MLNKIVNIMEKNNTEKDIMAAAEELFLEKGFKMATTTGIAEKAGVTHAMLHYYFRTKEQIFIKILDKNMGEMFDALKTVMSPDMSFIEILKSVVDIHFDFLNRHRRFPQLLYDVVRNNPEMLERYKSGIENIFMTEYSLHGRRLETEIKAGRICPISPHQLMFTIFSLNVAPFFALPMLESVLKLSGEQTDAFLEERKRESLATLLARLKVKE